MKRFLLLICAFSLIGCTVPLATMRQKVLEETKAVEIQQLPTGYQTDWLIKMEDGSVWYVQSSNGSIYAKARMFGPFQTPPFIVPDK